MKFSLFKWRHQLALATAVCAAGVFLDSKQSAGSLDLFDTNGADLLSALPLALSSYSLTALLLGGWRFAWVVCQTLRRDIKGILVFVQMKMIMRKHTNNAENIPSLFRKTVEKYGDKTCFFFEDQKWSFNELDSFSNRVANYFLSRRWDPETKPVAALMMESRPEFVGFWLGLTKIDIPTALLNSKLRLGSIAHSLQAVDAKCLIYDSAHRPFIDAARHLFPPGILLLSYHPGSVAACGTLKQELAGEPDTDFAARLRTFSSQPVPCHLRAQSTFGDVMLYIFTSGTTGLPKAALMRQQRFYVSHFAMAKAFNITPDDVVYNCLPLYHAAGTNLGVGLALMHGCSVVLTKKFSARGFWDDCRKYDATVIQYIGEICRYLVAQPPRDNDSKNSVRLALGNGLRPNIWAEFQKRFAIDQIGEFYAATEGNANMLNTANRQGSVGFTSPLFRAFHPISLVKMDKDNEFELRDENGLCIHCEPGEEGQLVGRIPDGDRLLQFDGYVNKSASSKKVLRDVWKKGDRAFASGDVMVSDELGFVFFRDRIGDTYRWKGENVSTAEVESVITEILGFAEDVAVFGVAIPNTEGRAGMAAIHAISGVDFGGGDDDARDNTHSRKHAEKLNNNRNVGDLDLERLCVELKRQLPAYAIPIFLWIRKSPADSTGTFKIKKAELKSTAYDLNQIGAQDQIYFLDTQSGKYVLLDDQHLQLIKNGDLRF